MLLTYFSMSFDWFQERIGKTVLVEGKDDVWRETTIKSVEDAKNNHLMSLEGYSYSDMPSEANVCLACEG